MGRGSGGPHGPSALSFAQQQLSCTATAVAGSTVHGRNTTLHRLSSSALRYLGRKPGFWVSGGSCIVCMASLACAYSSVDARMARKKSNESQREYMVNRFFTMRAILLYGCALHHCWNGTTPDHNNNRVVNPFHIYSSAARLVMSSPTFIAWLPPALGVKNCFV